MNNQVSNDAGISRRASPRRSADNCITVIDGRAYPVYNWSDGGLLIGADERLFSVDSPIQVTMKFRLTDRILDVPTRGRIIRKARDRLAIQFAPLTKDLQKMFKQVVDDYVTREFMESQLV